MIPRYSRPQMAALWEPENYFRIQLDIEAYACEAQEKLGVIPTGTAKALRERGRFEVERIREIEREVHHETIAFLTNLAEHVGPEARFVHQGMTSSDVLDTCFAVQLTQAGDILLADLAALLTALKRRAFEHKLTPTVGRSHGIHAEPTTFGLKLAENLTGLARIVRSAVVPALENVALWHERDISHSSVERVIGPDTTIALDFALARLTGLMDHLVVYPERMRQNLEALGGLVDSQRVLLALTQAGMTREDAYRAVQRNAMTAWDGKGRFADLLKRDTEITRFLEPQTIDGLFDSAYHSKHVDTIFRRVFGE